MMTHMLHLQGSMPKEELVYKQSKKDISRRIDVSLAYMAKYYPGPHSQQEIAEFCGCNQTTIRDILERALAKIRKEMIDEVC